MCLCVCIPNDTQLSNGTVSATTVDPNSNIQKLPIQNEINKSSTIVSSTNNIQSELWSIPVKSSVLNNHISVCSSLQNLICTPTTSAIDLVESRVVWPGKKNSNSTRKQEYIPSVLTSEKWQKIMVAKGTEKENKEKKPYIIRKDEIMKKASSLNKKKLYR